MVLGCKFKKAVTAIDHTYAATGLKSTASEIYNQRPLCWTINCC